MIPISSAQLTHTFTVQLCTAVGGSFRPVSRNVLHVAGVPSPEVAVTQACLAKPIDAEVNAAVVVQLDAGEEEVGVHRFVLRDGHGDLKLPA